MRSFEVFLTRSAVSDLQGIFDYIARHDSPEKAGYVLDKIEKTFAALSRSPERGAYPKELQNLGIRDYREVFFKPYRIIYRITAHRVYILIITDGRRDMQALLEHRLLTS